VQWGRCGYGYNMTFYFTDKAQMVRTAQMLSLLVNVRRVNYSEVNDVDDEVFQHLLIPAYPA
jgi:hypothetical protein